MHMLLRDDITSQRGWEEPYASGKAEMLPSQLLREIQTAHGNEADEVRLCAGLLERTPPPHCACATAALSLADALSPADALSRMTSWATEGDRFPGIKSENHEQCVSFCCGCAALLRAPERILCENPLLTGSPPHPLHRVHLWSCADCIWKSPGDDCNSPLQAAAFSYQLLDRLSGLCRLLGGFGTGANAAGLEDLVSALTCVGGCQIAVNQSWVLVNFLLFFIPTLVMIVLYSKIFLIAKHQARQIESLSNKTGRCSDRYQDRVARRERKAARTLGVAVLAFLISWLPYFLDSIIDAFLGFITPTYVYEILVWIAYYNSAMNPLIYGFFYPWFRKAIKLIVTGKVLRENSSTVNLFSG
nr:trace amine-associated receptor 7b-like [Odocoileus virginianus texanus]